MIPQLFLILMTAALSFAAGLYWPLVPDGYALGFPAGLLIGILGGAAGGLAFALRHGCGFQGCMMHDEK